MDSLSSAQSDQALLQVSSLQAKGMATEVSFELAAGTGCLLVGESGSGKSQLLKSLADLIEHQGSVSLRDTNMNNLCPEHWRAQVMYFAAETAWWANTVGEHFEHSPSEESLQALGLNVNYLNKPVAELSSGEKQRLALLRGLAYQPSVLLLDEITANLDAASTLKVEAFLAEYTKTQQAAWLWVTHDESQQQRLQAEYSIWSMADLYDSTQESVA